jgi:serine/threonine-protein kinase
MHAAMGYSRTVDPIVGDLGAGTILGRYELLAPIAQGGMAMVWAARLQGTRGFQKIVGIKTMLPSLGEDPAFEQMFLDEASLASQVRHPNVVEILDLGEQDGILYLVMEWIDGEPLSLLMKRTLPRSTPYPIAVRMALQACQGLHAAHELRDEAGELVGLVHRDVSPQNVLVTYGGVVKVVDFGVAKAAGRITAETGAGQIKGKIPYMSPEQATGGAIDRRTDVFAMGILLYMLTTGRHPFRRENEAQTLMSITSPKPVVPPRGFLADYPADLSQIVVRALAKDPDKRFPTANALAMALDGLPRSLRAGSDEEVADHVKSLLSDRVEKRRHRLREALRAADERAVGRISLTTFNPESTISSPTALSAIGPLPAAAAASSPASQSGIVERTSGVTPASSGMRSAVQGASSTRVLALVASLLAAAVVVGAVALARTEPPSTGPREPASASPAPPPAAALSTLEAAPSQVATSLAARAASAEATQSDAALPAAKPAPEAPARRFAPASSAPLTAASAPAPKPAPARSTQPFVSPIRDPGF